MIAEHSFIVRAGAAPQTGVHSSDRHLEEPVGLASFRLLFINRFGLVEGAELQEEIKRTFGDAVEIMTIARIADLGAREAKRADIVFVLGTGARCRAKTRLKIHECCPLASTIYLTTAHRPSAQGYSDTEVIYLSRSQSIPLNRILVAIFRAMRRQICSLKLALGSPELETSSATNVLEKLFLLTPQETRTLVAVRQGMPNKLIARHLNVTVRTVKAHLTEIFRKTGFAQRAELIAKCAQLAASHDTFLQDHAAEFKRRDASSAGSSFARRSPPKTLGAAKAAMSKPASHTAGGNPGSPQMSVLTRR